jgi:voltage-gated potassium channel Kch
MTKSRRQPLASSGRKVRNAPRPNVIERRMTAFLRKPPSIRAAAGVIVTATTLVVVGAGALMRVLDHSEYANIWVGMWWSLQTVTTVGYGDVTPKEPIGRVVGAFVMLEGIAFLAIITAAITSSFVARAERERELADEASDAELGDRLDARLDELDARFDRVEGMLRDLGKA